MSIEKLNTLHRIVESGLVAIIRADVSDHAARIAESCANGGVTALEVTFTVPGAAGVIEALSKQYKSDEMIIGAGTVLDPETARIPVIMVTAKESRTIRDEALSAGADGFVQKPYEFEELLVLIRQHTGEQG